MRILLVEDDESVASVLQAVLTDEHYAVDVANEGDMGWQLVNAYQYDLVVLDVVLPKLDGLQFCQRLREHHYTMPVLLVTALDSSNKKIAGFKAGADDYITKPFEIQELLARIRVLLRRVQTSVIATLTWDKLRLEPNSREVTYGSRPLNLTPKEYGLLELFLRNPSQVFSRRAILDSLWSYSEAPGEETVTSHIKGLRRKLSQAGAPTDLVSTVYGVGYRLKSIDTSAPGVRAVPPTSHTEASTAEHSATESLTARQLTTERSVEPASQSSLAAAKTQTKRAQEQPTRLALARLWESAKFQQLERLEKIERAARSSAQHQLSNEIRETARQAAHSLTGALGIFGLTAGSSLARKVEAILEGNRPITLSAQQQFHALVENLRKTIEQAAGPPEQPPNKASRKASRKALSPLLVIVDDDGRIELTSRLIDAARTENISISRADTLGELSALLLPLRPEAVSGQGPAKASGPKGTVPDAVLFNFSLRECNSDSLSQLSASIHQIVGLRVLVCSADDSLFSRVKAAQLGDYPFVCDLDAKAVLSGIKMLRSRHTHPNNKVLAVDDDPQVLAALRTFLEPQGFEIVTLNRSADFWRTLQKTCPDLLLLDIEMPNYSGIELCQAVRQAPLWNHIPVVFLTSHTDTQSQAAALRAGANDLVEKSLPHLDLLAHLYRQLQRVQSTEAMVEIASL